MILPPCNPINKGEARHICRTSWEQWSTSSVTLLGGKLMSKKLNPSSKSDLSSAAAISKLTAPPLRLGLLRDRCQNSDNLRRLE